jgi:hypothetical protein
LTHGTQPIIRKRAFFFGIMTYHNHPSIIIFFASPATTSHRGTSLGSHLFVSTHEEHNESPVATLHFLNLHFFCPA